MEDDKYKTQKELVIMECGHPTKTLQMTFDASGTFDYEPVCVICGCNDVLSPEPDFSNRKAVCPLCQSAVPSSIDLAGFRYQKTKKYDTCYDGCIGKTKDIEKSILRK